jgi:chemotaxis response regulator CheB
MVIGAHDFIAGMVSGILEKDSRIEVAATPVDGIEAVSQFRDAGIEVVVFDIGGNPGDALTTLSRILRVDGKAQVIMVSTLNFTNVKTAIEGLEKGAAEFLQTPAPHQGFQPRRLPPQTGRNGLWPGAGPPPRTCAREGSRRQARAQLRTSARVHAAAGSLCRR